MLQVIFFFFFDGGGELAPRTSLMGCCTSENLVLGDKELVIVLCLVVFTITCRVKGFRLGMVLYCLYILLNLLLLILLILILLPYHLLLLLHPNIITTLCWKQLLLPPLIDPLLYDHQLPIR